MYVLQVRMLHVECIKDKSSRSSGNFKLENMIQKATVDGKDGMGNRIWVLVGMLCSVAIISNSGFYAECAFYDFLSVRANKTFRGTAVAGPPGLPGPGPEPCNPCNWQLVLCALCCRRDTLCVYKRRQTYFLSTRA